MDNKQLILIIIAIIIAGLIIGIGCFYGLSQNNAANDTTTNTTDAVNNTNLTVEHISSDSQDESYSEPQYYSDTGEPISEADYKTLEVYGKSANSPEEWEAQKASLGY